jgi:hypothetical protein
VVNFGDRARVTSKREVIGSSAGLVPLNALVSPEDLSSDARPTGWNFKAEFFSERRSVRWRK